MNTNEKLGMVEKIQNNRHAFFAFNDQAQGMVEKYWGSVEIRHKGEWQKPWFPFSKIDDGAVVRLRTDFELPKRFFFSFVSLEIACPESKAGLESFEESVANGNGWIEVQESYLPYLEKMKKQCPQPRSKPAFGSVATHDNA